MHQANSSSSSGRRKLWSLDWLNFFLADVQTGVGPFLAAVLTAKGWNPAQIGTFLTFGGLLGIFLQPPAGAAVDATRHKRALIAAGIISIIISSMLLAFGHGFWPVALAQLVLGSVGPFIGPAVTAITLGLAGKAFFDARLGRNHAFDSAGNVCAAALMGWIGWKFGMKAVFLIIPILSIPAFLSLAAIPARQIDYWAARGACTEAKAPVSNLKILTKDRVLLAFSLAACLFHFANAAMLPQLGEMLSKGHVRAAAPFMAASITVTQLVIATTAAAVGKLSARLGPRPLLLLGFAVLPVRGILYTLTSSIPLLLSIQILDGVANSIFGIASAVFIANRTRGSGHFNLSMGGLGTVVGIGAALSNSVAGFITEQAGFHVSFLVLAGIALLAFICLAILVPDTRESPTPQQTPAMSAHGVAGITSRSGEMT